MDLNKVKRIAAQVLKIGTNRVWFDPEQSDKISEVITKDDVRELVKEGVIKKRQVMAQSRGRARVNRAKKTAGRKKGLGKRKGTKKARTSRKKNWMKNVRAQRKKLKELREEFPKDVEKVGYSNVYRKIKGGFFRGKKYVESFVKENK